jgi:protein-L-isoaspartate(D-aspartate) O-methyltransferase
MVEAQLVGRGIPDPAVLQAMGLVSRASFLPAAMADLAEEDGAVALGPGTFLPPPYLTALLLQSADIAPGMSVLLVDPTSGYLAALIEALGARAIDSGAASPADRFDRAVVLEASEETAVREIGRVVVGGSLVAAIPVGAGEREVVRLHRLTADTTERTLIEHVRFAILPEGGGARFGAYRQLLLAASRQPAPSAARLIADAAEPFESIEGANLAPLLDRIPPDTRLVLIGEASHGTSEFYRMRARITRELVPGGDSRSSRSRRTGPTRRTSGGG